jgi:PRTRC genetic system protein C
MAEKIKLKRIFLFKDLKLEDPNEDFTPIEVIKHYSGLYPEMTVATLGSQKVNEDGTEIHITIQSKVGTNG